jgi:hypothetical protein
MLRDHSKLLTVRKQTAFKGLGIANLNPSETASGSTIYAMKVLD